MRRLRELILRFGGLFNKQDKDRELDDEIESHLQMHIEDNLRSGMTPEEARREALIKLGGIESMKEAYRDQRGIPMLETLWQDIRYGARQLRKNPGFTAVAVLTLALGIGATTSIFSIVNAVVIKPLPYPKSSQLVGVWEQPPKGTRKSVSPGVFKDWKEHSRSFEALSVVSPFDVNLTGDDKPERLRSLQVSANYLEIFGVRPTLGHGFLPSDDQPGEDNKVVILTHGLWQRRFGGDPSVIGRTIRLNHASHTVIGVLPQKPALDPGVELFLPYVLTNEPWQQTRENHLVFAVGRIIGTQLYGVKATDPFTFGSVCLLLVSVGALASWLPAQRAAKVDPMVALRYE